MDTGTTTQELLLTQNRSSQTKPSRPGENGDGENPSMFDQFMTKFFDGEWYTYAFLLLSPPAK